MGHRLDPALVPYPDGAVTWHYTDTRLGAPGAILVLRWGPRVRAVCRVDTLSDVAPEESAETICIAMEGSR